VGLDDGSDIFLVKIFFIAVTEWMDNLDNTAYYLSKGF